MFPFSRRTKPQILRSSETSRVLFCSFSHEAVAQNLQRKSRTKLGIFLRILESLKFSEQFTK